MVRQERTGGVVTRRPCKPHLEQDQIGGRRAPGQSPGWSHEPAGNDRPREMVTAPASAGGTELGL